MSEWSVPRPSGHVAPLIRYPHGVALLFAAVSPTSGLCCCFVACVRYLWAWRPCVRMGIGVIHAATVRVVFFGATSRSNLDYTDLYGPARGGTRKSRARPTPLDSDRKWNGRRGRDATRDREAAGATRPARRPACAAERHRTQIPTRTSSTEARTPQPAPPALSTVYPLCAIAARRRRGAPHGPINHATFTPCAIQTVHPERAPPIRCPSHRPCPASCTPCGTPEAAAAAAAAYVTMARTIGTIGTASAGRTLHLTTHTLVPCRPGDGSRRWPGDAALAARPSCAAGAASDDH